MNLSLIKQYHYIYILNNCIIYSILWGFYLLFISHWLLRTKNKFDVHIPYTDIQSTHWYIYIHTTINIHKYNIGRWQESIFVGVWHTIYRNIFQRPEILDTHTNYTGWAKETEGNLLYVQIINLQYFLAVAFKSTNCHADSSIYWHSFCEDILSACTVLSRRLPPRALDTIGTTWEWQWLWTSALLVRETLKRNLRGEALVGWILW